MDDTSTVLGTAETFTLLFVMLGPLKLLGPFARQTQGLDESTVKGLALRVFVVTLVAALAGGFLGRTLLAGWNVSLSALMLAAGVIFFLVALRLVLEQYDAAPAAPPAPLPPEPMAAALKVAFPLVLTPYGIATVIALLAATRNPVRAGTICALVVAVMILNLLAMLFARKLMHGATVLVMQLLGAVLGVLQVALAAQIIIDALVGLGIVAA